ncbi:MAG: hypothetical protein JRF25_04060 [Deltaproteobacteria bacterium]|nr:hypothetical protein [Deltaproteobacteria bacterium]
MKEEIEAKLKSAISECDAHIKKLIRGKQLLGEYFPIRLDSFKCLEEDQIEHIDQFIYRFTKLQDSIGLRLLPTIFMFIENDARTSSFLDILNKLEKLNVLSSTADWQFFRNLRNNLAHDYPESIQQTVDTLNILFKEWPKMELIYSNAKEYYLEKIEPILGKAIDNQD